MGSILWLAIALSQPVELHPSQMIITEGDHMRAVQSARRVAIIQERAMLAKMLRQQRVEANVYVSQRPTINVSAWTPIPLPRPMVYWESPNYRPRDVDVILVNP